MQFRGAGCAVFVEIHPFLQGKEPVRGDLYVGVYQHEVFRIILFQFPEGPVVASCEAVIAVEAQQLQLRHLLAEPVRGTVLRSIVGNDYLGIHIPDRVNETRKESPEEVLSVPVQYDYSCFHSVRLGSYRLSLLLSGV